MLGSGWTRLGYKEIKADISPLHILFYQQLFPHPTPKNKTFVELLSFVLFTSLFIHFPKDIIMYHSVWFRWKTICMQCRDPGSIPGLGRSSGEGHGNPLQYSCLQNPMDRGAWRATVHGVAKSQTWLSNTHTHRLYQNSPPEVLQWTGHKGTRKEERLWDTCINKHSKQINDIILKRDSLNVISIMSHEIVASFEHFSNYSHLISDIIKYLWKEFNCVILPKKPEHRNLKTILFVCSFNLIYFIFLKKEFSSP